VLGAGRRPGSREDGIEEEEEEEEELNMYHE
jgi:hypothetical protein